MDIIEEIKKADPKYDTRGVSIVDLKAKYTSIQEEERKKKKKKLELNDLYLNTEDISMSYSTTAHKAPEFKLPRKDDSDYSIFGELNRGPPPPVNYEEKVDMSDRRIVEPAQAIASEENKRVEPAQAIAPPEENKQVEPAPAIASEENKRVEPAPAIASEENKRVEPAPAIASEENKQVEPAPAIASEENKQAEPIEDNDIPDMPELEDDLPQDATSDGKTYTPGTDLISDTLSANNQQDYGIGDNSAIAPYVVNTTPISRSVNFVTPSPVQTTLPMLARGGLAKSMTLAYAILVICIVLLLVIILYTAMNKQRTRKLMICSDKINSEQVYGSYI